MTNGQLLRRLRRLVTGAGGDATDQQLLERYAAEGDEDAFAALVRRHGPLVHGVCRRILGNSHDADDAFQATFLVLAKKAGTVVWRESIANWLYGVAYRTASRVRVQGASRSRHEQAAGSQRMPPDAEHAEARELRQLLDEELIRLPERYRMPVLLCCLHDQTINEAAQQLGWSFATVKNRVQRGRDMLRQRLQRRGIELSAGVLAAIVANGVGATVAPPLLGITVKSIIAGPVSEPVAALGKGVLQAMFREKLTRVAVAALILGLIGTGAAIPVYRAWAAKPAAAVLAPNPAAEEPQTARQLPAEVRGQKVLAIFGLEGQPKDDIQGPLQKAGVKIIQRIQAPDDDRAPGLMRLLLDTDGKDPAKVLTGLPRFLGAIVFQDGNYVRGLPLDMQFAGYRKGQVPAPFAVAAATMPQGMPALLERYHRIPGVKAEHVPPRGRGVGFIKLTPKDAKTTLLEVFLRTGCDFEYTDPPGQAAVKDGLAVTVTPVKKVFAAKEDPAFEICYKNVSDKAFLLPDQPGLYGFWTYYIESLSDNKTFTARSILPKGAGALAEPAGPIQPGADLKVTVPLPANAFGIVEGNWGNELRPKNALMRLPPGKYRVKIHIAFVQGLEDKVRVAPIWPAGEIITQPVEIEIAAAEPDKK